jgi:hypothetical protein
VKAAQRAESMHQGLFQRSFGGLTAAVVQQSPANLSRLQQSIGHPTLILSRAIDGKLLALVRNS